MIQKFFSVFLLVFLVVGCTSNRADIPSQSTPAPDDTVSVDVSSEPTEEPFPTDTKVILRGEAVCLPHKDQSGPQTLECAFGIKTDKNVFYGVQLGEEDQYQFEIGKEYTIEGYQKSEPTSLYAIAGVVRVTLLK